MTQPFNKKILYRLLIAVLFILNGLLAIEPVGDTLTVVQRPILSIPEIITPGETMDILCLADESTNNWQAKLLYNDIVVNLSIASSIFDNNSGLWTLVAEIPIPDLYELYDLQITASNEIYDVTKNSVQLIPSIRDQYYFIHITDTHLPTRVYWTSDPETAVTDSTTMVRLRNIINDVNLLNPEFVLITGDIINEGELEDLDDGRVYSRTKRILGEFEVPIYLVAGNHDIGGWVATPGPQGSARRNWWKFFGWKDLEFYPTYTQNYTFDYGNILFIGMESYNNYDSFMYNIYGQYSFISSQLNWLNNQLDNSSLYDARVLFYHYDFSDQINLSTLGAEMSLAGHTHSNYNDFTSPYNITTRAACHSDAPYRVIKVNNNTLDPQYTSVSFYGDNDQVFIDYSPSNDGLVDSVSAFIHNANDIEFENAKIKFVMPAGNYDFDVTNGTLLQIDNSGDYNVCYVQTSIPSNSDTYVTIKAHESAGNQFVEFSDQFELFSIYPNPFNPIANISFSIPDLDIKSNVSIHIFDVSGKIVETLTHKIITPGSHTIKWDASNHASGVYFVQMISGHFSATQKIILLK